jgi:transposase
MKIKLEAEQIFIASQPIDFRKAIDGLCNLVVDDLKKEPSSGIYIFYNKHFNRIKVLGWHRNGFVMVYKKLERGKFFVHSDGENLQINSEQLNWLLTGIDWQLLSNNECKYQAFS